MVQKRKSPTSRPPKPKRSEATSGEVAPAAKRRGRPRSYEPDVVLGQALDQFRKTGFAATSLDDLSAATGLNRPSLYGAFGDKRELYIKSLKRYSADVAAALAPAFGAELPIRERLRAIYRGALDIYMSGSDGPRGCFSIMTVASEAIADPEIRAIALERSSALDRAYARSFQLAIDAGEIGASASPAALAQLASAITYSLALRARAGVPRAELEAIADAAVDLICGQSR